MICLLKRMGTMNALSYPEQAGKKTHRSRWIFCTVLLGFLFLFLLRENAAAAPYVPGIAAGKKLKNAEIYDTGHGFICRKNGKKVRMKDTWFMIGDDVYYCNEKGYVQTGAFTWQGNVYRANRYGKLYISKWYRGSKTTSYYGMNGIRLAKRWKKLNGLYYYFDKNGNLVKDQWVGSYYVNHKGIRIHGLVRKKNTGTIPKGFRAGTGTNEGYLVSRRKKLIISGASRVSQMRDAVGPKTDVVYISKGSMKYSWCSTYALPQIRAWLDVYPRSIVVLQFGNNDVAANADGHFVQYRQLYLELIRDYPQATICIMDILPGDLKLKKEMNKKRRAFNARMHAAFPENCIGGYDFMVKNGFETYDGLHYTNKTYQMIYAYICKVTGWNK